MTDITVKTVLKEVALNPTTFDLDIENMLKSTSHGNYIIYLFTFEYNLLLYK